MQFVSTRKSNIKHNRFVLFLRWKENYVIIQTGSMEVDSGIQTYFLVSLNIYSARVHHSHICNYSAAFMSMSASTFRIMAFHSTNLEKKPVTEKTQCNVNDIIYACNIVLTCFVIFYVRIKYKLYVIQYN